MNTNESAKDTKSAARAHMPAVDKAICRAFVETIAPLYHQLAGLRFGEGKTSAAHLGFMCQEILARIEAMPVDKIGRWVGFIQGVMAANGHLDVDSERDRTRPIFECAYLAKAQIEVAALSPLPVAAESMKPGEIYIWSTREKDGVLVMLNPDRDGFVELHEEDDWYFQDNLVGSLYGPIALTTAKQEG